MLSKPAVIHDRQFSIHLVSAAKRHSLFLNVAGYNDFKRAVVKPISKIVLLQPL